MLRCAKIGGGVSGIHLVRLGGWILRLGALSLLWKTGVLLRQALQLGLEPVHLAWLLPLAAAGGWGKARFVMRRRMVANRDRLLAHRGRLWPWQLYPPQLFAFIAAMVMLMAWLRQIFAGRALPTALLGAMDLAIAAALLASAGIYSAAGEGSLARPTGGRPGPTSP